MIDIPISEMRESDVVASTQSVYQSNNTIYPGGHTAQVEYKDAETLLMCTIYGPHICKQFFKKNDDKCVVDVKCKFPASIRDDPIEEELQLNLKRMLESCVKRPNYPGWIISVVIDICSIHADSTKNSLISACFNATMFSMNKAGVALKINGCAITYWIKQESKGFSLIASPTENEEQSAEWAFTIIVNAFQGSSGILELITHKGVMDLKILTSDKLIKSVDSVCSKHVENLKTHKELSGL